MVTELTRSEQIDVSQVRLWARFQSTARHRLALLEKVVEAAQQGSATDGVTKDLRHGTRRLAEAFASFGFPEAAGLAREVASLLESWPEGPVSPQEAGGLAVHLVKMHNELERGPSASAMASLRSRRKRRRASPSPKSPPGPASPHPGPQATRPPLILIVARPSETLDKICIAATDRGFRISQVQEVPGSAEALARLQPDVVLLEMAEPAGQEKLRLLHRLAPSIPVIGLLARGDLEERFQTLEAGAVNALDLATVPVPARELVDRLWASIWNRASEKARILVVDDDDARLAGYREILETDGYHVSTLDHPQEFLAALQEATPDLVVMEIDTPGVGGIELCRVLRSDPQWTGLPIILAGPPADTTILTRAFGARADDYVSRLATGPELRCRIANRLARVETLRSVGRRDTRTGLQDLPQGMGRLEQLVRLARRHRQPLCIGIVEPDSMAAVRSARGEPAARAVMKRLARLLEGALHEEDVLYRGEGEAFVVGLYGIARDDGLDRLAQVLEHFRNEAFTDSQGETFRATFWASVATFAADGGSLAALLERARDGLARAPGERNRVVSATARTEEAQAGWDCDIFLVEPEPGLAELVVDMLHTRGYRVQHARNGRETLDALCGDVPRVKTRLVLLETALPDLDGDVVLERLAATVVLRQTRVIVAKARGGPEQVLRAMERGAFDSIVKPFGVDLLLARVRRALGS